MSETELEDDRGESYLEIQMDRSTIVLAALGLVVLLAGAFLLGSWFGSRSADEADAASATGAEAEAGEAALDEHDGEPQGEVVEGEEGFGGKPVSARGAPAVSAVPQATAGRTATPTPSPGPADGIAEEEVTPARGATAAKAASSTAAKAASSTAAKATAAKATAAKATAAKATAAKATAAPPPPTASASGTWIVQVAAVKDRPEAEQLAARLRKKGWPVRIVEEAGFVKVQVGPYDTQAAGRTAEQRLKREERLGTWLKRG